MDQAFAMNVSIGLKVIHVNGVVPVVLEMQHPWNHVDLANVMAMEMMLSVFVIFKAVNASANTIQKETIVKSAMQITMEIQ